jgi:hypothetical protein
VVRVRIGRHFDQGLRELARHWERPSPDHDQWAFDGRRANEHAFDGLVGSLTNDNPVDLSRGLVTALRIRLRRALRGETEKRKQKKQAQAPVATSRSMFTRSHR